MHELSVCQALMTQIADIVQVHASARVERITIEVGPLSGTEPNLLLAAFLAMRGGPTAEATLLIEHSPVCISCLTCGTESETPANRLLCAQCGGWRTRVISGDGLRLMKVELRTVEMLPSRTPAAMERSDYV